MSRSYADKAEPQWFVQAQERVWGPYPESRVERFIAEGRVAATTLVSRAPLGPFAPAGQKPDLRTLFPTAVPAPKSPPSAHAKSEPTPPGAEPSLKFAGQARPLLVFAKLSSLEAAVFEGALAIHGPFERIGGGLWLIRARGGSAALRNALSRRLNVGDTLLVVEATLEQVAWFNLNLTEERRLRTLWAG